MQPLLLLFTLLQTSQIQGLWIEPVVAVMLYIGQMNRLVLPKLNTSNFRPAVCKAILFYLYLNPHRCIYRSYYSLRNNSPMLFKTSSIHTMQLWLLPPLTVLLLTVILPQLVLIVSKFIANCTTLLGLQKLLLELHLDILSFTFITLPILLISVCRIIYS